MVLLSGFECLHAKHLFGICVGWINRQQKSSEKKYLQTNEKDFRREKKYKEKKEDWVTGKKRFFLQKRIFFNQIEYRQVFIGCLGLFLLFVEFGLWNFYQASQVSIFKIKFVTGSVRHREVVNNALFFQHYILSAQLVFRSIWNETLVKLIYLFLCNDVPNAGDR